MKKTLTLLACLISIFSFTQLPYSWTPNVDPGWTSSNAGDGTSLDWQNSCNAVAVNCVGYSNNQNTTYTSPVIDASCNNASTIIISFDLLGNIESGWDFLFMEYSTDGGGTWINFYGPNMGLTGNAGAGITWTLPTIPTSNTLMFRFRFESDFIVTFSGYQITNFQINCDVQLPIELKDFTAKKDGVLVSNIIEWSTYTERNNDYFTIERSVDGINWTEIATVSGSGITTEEHKYMYSDKYFKRDTINYYRLKQTDYDGLYEYFDIVSVDNRSNKKIKMILNMLGQKVDLTYKGIIIIVYDDGTSIKKYNR